MRAAAPDPELVSALEQRRVRRACHFTRLESWTRIREVGGLLPVSALHRDRRSVVVNDRERLDRHTFHNCLTRIPECISAFEVHVLFGGDWIVLMFAPEVAAVEELVFLR